MNTNPWAAPKDKALRRLLLAMAPKLSDQCDLISDPAQDPRILTLRHIELERLRAHVYLHGQRQGTYGIFFEYPHPVPGILESEENLPLQQAVQSLALHFDA
jgi:hypothetical protein